MKYLSSFVLSYSYRKKINVSTAVHCKQKSFICTTEKEQGKPCYGYTIMWGLAEVFYGIQIFETTAGVQTDLGSKNFSCEFSGSRNGLKN